MSDIEKTPEKILERRDVKERIIDLEKKFAKLESRLAEFEDFMQQWKTNFKEKKPQINLEAAES